MLESIKLEYEEYPQKAKPVNTSEGGKKTAKTNKKKYGDDFYSKIGAKGGKRKVPKGLALMSPEYVKEFSKLGIKKRRENAKNR